MSIKIENLKHVYNAGSPFESIALDGVNLEIEKGEFIGLIGHTGSGKSTLIQHLNGLLKPFSGKIYINGLDITDSYTSLTEIRKKVGLVFQYPEYQLFEETIYKDIAYGPSNLGLDEIEIDKRIRESMEMTGLDFDKLKDRSPFELSGGQKRRVAIAGVLAMKPEVLILDEPTAGLDPKGRDEILAQIKKLHDQTNTTIILVSHSMEDVAKLVTRIIAMNRGRVEFCEPPTKLFKHGEKLKEIGLGVPKIVDLVTMLRQRGFEISEDIITLEEAKEAILKELRRDKNA